MLKLTQGLTDLSEIDPDELLKEAINSVLGKEDGKLEILLKHLLDLEKQVAHLARPHKILVSIEELLQEHLEDA